MAVEKTAFALIAQLDRASGYGPEGREFESSSARQKKPFCFCRKVFSIKSVLTDV